MNAFEYRLGKKNNARMFGIRCLRQNYKRTPTDIKQEMRKTLSSMSLLKIAGEKLPRSQKSSLEMTNYINLSECLKK